MKSDRLSMICLTLAEVDKHNKSAVVIPKLACIYKFLHTDRSTGKEMTQIAVGLVQKVHKCPTTSAELVDIRFCPPKGARPASKNRPDTLYQDISPDFSYNTHYRTTIGEKVEDEDSNLEKSVMLAFNLTLNKDGHFSKQRSNDSPYNMSSYALAENVIREFYSHSV